MPRAVRGRGIGLTGAVLLLAVAGGVTAASPPAIAAGPACPAKIIQLPGLADSADTAADVMNDKGTVLGESSPRPRSGLTEHLVEWRDGNAPVDLGLVNRRIGPGRTTNRSFVDVTNHGLIAVQVETFGRGVFRASGELRRGDTVRRLHGTSKLPLAYVTGVNDDGIAVGYLESTDVPADEVPVVWLRGGRMIRLPLHRAFRPGGVAIGINNRGLVIGSVTKRSKPPVAVAWWRLGGKHGLLRPLKGTYIGEAHFVDNRGHIVGRRPNWTFWRGVSNPPRETTFDYGLDIEAMSGQGLFVSLRYTASLERFDHAFIGHIGPPDRQATLPLPPGADFVFPTTDISQGVTPYAPQGGVTESGSVDIDDPGSGSHEQAILWTCAQTYLQTGSAMNRSESLSVRE